MTNMPVLDKNSAAQNILSTKATKPAAASAKGNFDTVLKQTTQTGRQSSDSAKKTETAKPAETKADDGTSKDRVDGSGKAEEKAGTQKTETQNTEKQAETEETAKDIPEDSAQDTEALERAGGEMVAVLAAQMGISEDAVREAMDDLGMTDVSLLDPKNVKDLMVHLTEGADDMSLLTDEAFYNSVTEALDALEELTAKLQEETGMSAEELKAAMQTAQNRLEKAPAVTEEITERQDLSGNQKTEESLRFQTPKPELTENARTENVPSKDMPKQESTGKDSESPFMGNSYQTQNLDADAQVQTAETGNVFSMADTQEIMDQILDYMKVSVKPEMTSLEMQLHPESLGTLHIQISNREGAVTAQFIAQNESVRAALESQVMELRENLEQQGLKVEAVEVTVAQYSLDRDTGGSEASSEQQNRQGRKGNRNINLNDLNPEEEEAFTEEEKLTAEMMQSSGSTVNYTA